MNAIKLLTSSAAALAVVGAGLVFAQTTPGTPSTTTDTGQGTQAQQTPPAGGTMTTPSAATPTTPSQETVQRSDTPMAPEAQADRN
jgi:hypothetical protein